jgi:hypothetical protein
MPACSVISVCGFLFRIFKKAFWQGRSKRGTEAYFFRYVEVPSVARTPLEAFFNILLVSR